MTQLLQSSSQHRFSSPLIISVPPLDPLQSVRAAGENKALQEELSSNFNGSTNLCSVNATLAVAGRVQEMFGGSKNGNGKE